MTERLLQFIWQFQYFNKNDLRTTAGDLVQVIHAGIANRHQGPDFLEAKIKIAEELWAGSVELHIESSGWHRHSHHLDRNYNNVVLHVVWNIDEEEFSREIPTLVLDTRVPWVLLEKYAAWMNSAGFIPCGQQITCANDLVWMSWNHRLVAERIHRKSHDVRKLLQRNNHHWEETCWWMLAKNMGLHVNADAFEEIAQSLSLALLVKHARQIQVLESLLLGQAGLLEEEFTDDYPLMLQKEYRFYSKKYGLKRIIQPIHFLRMRPPAFPTVRLAQLAMILNTTEKLFSSLLECNDVQQLRSFFDIAANSYWDYHFVFGEPSVYQPKSIGGAMVSSILINTVAPLIYTYGDYHDDLHLKERAFNLLSQIEAETNSTTKGFRKLGIKCRDAHASQALLELKNCYCDQRRCLDCAVGFAILNRQHV